MFHIKDVEFNQNFSNVSSLESLKVNEILKGFFFFANLRHSRWYKPRKTDKIAENTAQTN